MGIKKIKVGKTTKKAGGLIKAAKTTLGGVVSAISGKRAGGGRRRGKMTPERLARKILVERLKKKLYKLKYGGR